MRIDDLNEPVEARRARQQRRQDAADPIGHSSVTEGGLRIASDEGLIVEGSIHGTANTALGKPAHIEWGGTANFTGDVTARRFRVTTDEFEAVFSDAGLSFSGTAQIVGGGEVPYRASVTGAGFWMEFEGKEATISPNGLQISGLGERASTAGLRMVVFDPTTGAFGHAPIPTVGTGGNPGGTPYTGGWPVAPLPWANYNDDWSSDYGERVGVGKGWHDGIDFGSGVYIGKPFNAIGPGIVIDASDYTSEWAGSHAIVIRHDSIDKGSLAGKQIFSVYAHGSDSYVNIGDRVAAGQAIGGIGNEGQSDGAHLHLEIHVGSLYMYGDPGVGGSQDPVPIFNEYGGWP